MSATNKLLKIRNKAIGEILDMRDKVLNKSRSNLIHFSRFIKPDYQVNWHHRVVCSLLDNFADGEIKKLMIFQPPQTGKSQLSSRHLPSFILGQKPNTRVGLCSYAAELAQSFNRDVQRIIDSDEYRELFPETSLNEKNVATDSQGSYKRTANIFEIVGYNGYMRTVGIGGSLTGVAIDVGIVDDPFKDRKEASSETIRSSVWAWYTDVFETRLHNKSQQLILLTRWHEDDLAGRILDRDGRVEDGGDWTVVSFPALKEDNSNPYDPREIGEALWPEKHSRERMEKIKADSPSTFASLYQQRPAPAEGGMIKPDWFFRYNLAGLDPRATVHFYLDTAYTDKQVNDPTAILAFVRMQNKLYLKHCKVVRMNFPDLIKFIPEYIASQGGSGKSAVIIEPKASGLSVIQMLRKETDLNIIQDEAPKDSKITRVSGITPILESGRVGIPETGDWVPLFTNECAVFPNGVHDDRVDCLVGAVNKFLVNTPGRQRMRGSVV